MHEVQEVLKPVNWRHVRSEENQADAATRGHDGMTLKSSSLWWQGPSWLSELRIPDQPKLTKVGSERKKNAVLKSFSRIFGRSSRPGKFQQFTEVHSYTVICCLFCSLEAEASRRWQFCNYTPLWTHQGGWDTDAEQRPCRGSAQSNSDTQEKSTGRTHPAGHSSEVFSCSLKYDPC